MRQSCHHSTCTARPCTAHSPVPRPTRHAHKPSTRQLEQAAARTCGPARRRRATGRPSDARQGLELWTPWTIWSRQNRLKSAKSASVPKNFRLRRRWAPPLLFALAYLFASIYGRRTPPLVVGKSTIFHVQATSRPPPPAGPHVFHLWPPKSRPLCFTPRAPLPPKFHLLPHYAISATQRTTT